MLGSVAAHWSFLSTCLSNSNGSPTDNIPVIEMVHCVQLGDFFLRHLCCSCDTDQWFRAQERPSWQAFHVKLRLAGQKHMSYCAYLGSPRPLLDEARLIYQPNNPI